MLLNYGGPRGLDGHAIVLALHGDNFLSMDIRRALRECVDRGWAKYVPAGRYVWCRNE